MNNSNLFTDRSNFLQIVKSTAASRSKSRRDEKWVEAVCYVFFHCLKYRQIARGTSKITYSLDQT